MGTVLGPILGPDRPKRGQDEPKRAIRSFKEPKSCISKSLKNPQFFIVFGSRGSQENLKRPEKAPKRHPKRHPKVVQNLVKKWPKSEPKNEQKSGPKRVEKFEKVALTARCFQRFGLLKTLTSKMFKNCSRCLKTVPK